MTMVTGVPQLLVCLVKDHPCKDTDQDQGECQGRDQGQDQSNHQSLK